MLVTQRAVMNPFAQVLEEALQDGARLIQLREKDISDSQAEGLGQFIDLALQAQPLCERFGALLIANAEPGTAIAISAHGVQVPSHLASEIEVQGARAFGLLCGASAHSLQEARAAQEVGAHYIILGSIFPTASHPEAAPLGLQVLAEAAREVTIPIYAIGGIDPRNARACLEAGAHGVAAIRAAWNAEERRELLRVVGEF